MLANWLPRYEGEHCKIDARLRKKILSISAVQIDWFLAPRKLRFGNHGRCGTNLGESRAPVASAIRRINTKTSTRQHADPFGEQCARLTEIPSPAR